MTTATKTRATEPETPVVEDPVTHVFFDIDGTINACPSDATFTDYWGWGRNCCDRRVFVSNGLDAHPFTMHWSPDLIAQINELVARPDVVPHWLSTWEMLSRDRFSKYTGLNGEGWDVLGEREYANVKDGYDPTREWWKITALRQWWTRQGGNFRVVWCDDELIQHGAMLWCSTLPQNRMLPVVPAHNLGLSPSNLSMIRGWLE